MKTIPFLMAAAIFLSVACNSEQKQGGDTENTNTEETTERKESDALGQKLNVYVACINEVEPELLKAIETYKSWVDFSKGTDDKSAVRGISSIDPEHSFYKECFEGLKKVGSLGPKEAGLDTAGEAYKNATLGLTAISTEAEKYYKHSNYKDDGFKKGQELHPKLVAAIETYLSARTFLHENVDRVADARTALELLEVEKKEGRKIRFHKMNLMMEAKKLLANVHSEDSDTLAKINSQFAKAYQEAVAFNKANPKIADEASYWESVCTRAEDLQIAFKELARLRADGSVKKGDKKLNKAIEKVFKTYNKLVNKSNMMSSSR